MVTSRMSVRCTALSEAARLAAVDDDACARDPARARAREERALHAQRCCVDGRGSLPTPLARRLLEERQREARRSQCGPEVPIDRALPAGVVQLGSAGLAPADERDDDVEPGEAGSRFADG